MVHSNREVFLIVEKELTPLADFGVRNGNAVASSWFGRKVASFFELMKDANKGRLLLGLVAVISGIFLLSGLIKKGATDNAQTLMWIGGFGLGCSLATLIGSYATCEKQIEAAV